MEPNFAHEKACWEFESFVGTLASCLGGLATAAAAIEALRRRFRSKRKDDSPGTEQAVKPATLLDDGDGEFLNLWLRSHREQSPCRCLGLSVGITNYSNLGPKVLSLPLCADDARRMAWALERHGGMVTCLTDQGATAQALTSAFDHITVEAAASPNAVVWFFFSGHGFRGGESEDNIDEWDKRLGGLLLADGPLVDDDLGKLFRSLPDNTPLVVALDSCHSVGFMLEICGREGPTLFLASSDEDATSQVAVEYSTGGYLSHCLMEALNSLPTGAKMTAGWLQDFVLEWWPTNCKHRQSAYDFRGKMEPGRQWPTVSRTARHGQVIVERAKPFQC